MGVLLGGKKEGAISDIQMGVAEPEFICTWKWVICDIFDESFEEFEK